MVLQVWELRTRKNGDVVLAKLSEQEMGVVADYVLEQA